MKTQKTILFASISLMLAIFLVTAVSALAEIKTYDSNGIEQSDFAPNSDVHINGSGFLPLSIIFIEITDPHDILFLTTTSSNAAGKFSYKYDLNGKEGFYSASATDSASLAEVIFSDSAEENNTANMTCVEAKMAGLLTATVSGNTAKITNNANFSYQVGFAVYKMFDLIIDNQELFDNKSAIINPGQMINLTINFPQCAYQYDVFCGEVLPDLVGKRYGSRILLGKQKIVNNNFCEEEHICGNGIKEFGEQCDDGNDVDDDLCSNECMPNPLVCNDLIELVENGGFEFPEVTSSQHWNIFPNGTLGLEWVVEWKTAEPNFSTLTRPSIALIEFNEAFGGRQPYEGNQFTELASDWDGPSGSVNGEPAPTIIYQDLPTIPGENYTIMFAFSPRPGYNASNNILEFKWNGIVQSVISYAGSGTTNWTKYTYVLKATSNKTRVQFSDLSTQDSWGTFLDAVSVRCIPQNETEPECGDGIKDEGEQCDDGNLVNGDGCDNECKYEPKIKIIKSGPAMVIANSTIIYNITVMNIGNATALNEIVFDQIQNKNLTFISSQSSPECALNVPINRVECGPFNLLVAESRSFQIAWKHNQLNITDCNYNITNQADVSSANAPSDWAKIDTFIKCEEKCGDSIVQPPEQCDDGNDIDDDECNNDCKLTFCGNGIVEQGEQCDDGNDIDDDECNNDCKPNICIDKDKDKVCDEEDMCLDTEEGAIVDPMGCDNNQFCRKVICGPGCDDGDWLGNGVQEEPNDCMTIIRHIEGIPYPACVPVPDECIPE